MKNRFVVLFFFPWRFSIDSYIFLVVLLFFSGSMPNSRNEFLADRYYHIMNRSLNGTILFETSADYKTFILYVIENLLAYPSLTMTAYCVLPDHFHFVIKNKNKGFDISEFMRKLQVSYAMYFKKRHVDNPAIKGIPVFQWRFRAHLIEENDLENFESYVNRNAVAHQVVEDIKDRPYASIHQVVETWYAYKEQTHIKIYPSSKKIQKNATLVADLE